MPSRALIHRQRRHVVAVELDAPLVGPDQAGDHVKHRGLAGAVRAEQSHRLALADVEAHALNHLAADEGFFHAVDREHALALKRRCAVSFLAARSGRRRWRRREVLRRRALGPAVRRGLAFGHAIGRASRARLLRRRRRLLAARLALGRRSARNVQIGAVDRSPHAGEVDRILLGKRRLARRRTAAAEI